MTFTSGVLVKEFGVSEAKQHLSVTERGALQEALARFADDSRPGVVAAREAASRRLARIDAEMRRLEGMHALQRTLHAGGLRLIAGVDEVGRGALAGPVSAAAVIMSVDVRITGLDDSKRLTPERRVALAEEIRSVAIAIAVAHIDPAVIDRIGIAAANTAAMRAAVDALEPPAEHVIADGLRVDLGIPSTAVVGGDRLIAAVAAASIVAKVARDALMRESDVVYPAYGFAQNKGYGTLEHKEIIDRLGPCPLHRMSFSPCSERHLF